MLIDVEVLVKRLVEVSPDVVVAVAVVDGRVGHEVEGFDQHSGSGGDLGRRVRQSCLG
ncbi:hypothetical protein ND991_11135 [Gordonia sputi]|uniref:hypothetical protein n=1 Tax=Gordonia sputi TaxID=36823 RepID=UPI0020433EB1|nr:hypothetical protein [Gordonia sputi]MCM3895764.1 hypothetical protein [Gordonia sputi]